MVDFKVADSGGTYRTPSGLWVADATGAFRSVKNAWSSDDTGEFRKVWPPGVGIEAFSAVQGSPAFSNVVLSWSVSASSYVELRLVGSSTVLYTGTATTYTYTGAPGTKYSFTLRAYDAKGGYTDSLPVSVTLAPLPAPASFRRTSGDSGSSAWAWNGITGVSGYDLLDTLHSNTIKGSTSGTVMTETGLVASTTYERAVRSKLGASVSGLSNKVRYTTPAPPGSAPGTYTYNCVYQAAWAVGRNNWRPSGDGCIHGNGDQWYYGNHDQYTYFWYGPMSWRGLSGKVTRFKIHIKRDGVAGYSSPQRNRFGVHNWGAQPGGAPWSATDPYWAESGTLGWNQEGWFDLPVVWGQNFIDTVDVFHTGPPCGIVWGRPDANYMRGPGVAALSTQGQLAFTIG